MTNALPKLWLAAAAYLICAACWGSEPTVEEIPPSDGQLLVNQAAATITQYQTVQARVRQRVSLFERQLAGNGWYHQARSGDRVLLRLELKLPAGEYVTTLQQVNDGDRLWTRRDTPFDKRLTSVELRRVRQVIKQRPLTDLRQLTLGGIGQLLVGLDQQFQFDAPRAGSLGDVPVWVLEGRWKQPGAKGLAAAEQGRGGVELPHVPDSVLLVLSRSTELPLFPFRVEFARHVADAQNVVQRRALVSVDFYEVTVGTALDNRLFAYNAGDQEVIDSTDAYIQGL